MKVNVKGQLVEFPDSMSKDDIKEVLNKKFTKKDNTDALLQAIEALKALVLKPQVIKELEIKEVEKPVYIEKTRVETVKVPTVQAMSWHFSLERDDDGQITDIYAEPYGE